MFAAVLALLVIFGVPFMLFGLIWLGTQEERAQEREQKKIVLEGARLKLEEQRLALEAKRDRLLDDRIKELKR